MLTLDQGRLSTQSSRSDFSKAVVGRIRAIGDHGEPSLMTSSARFSTDCGTLRPSAFAALSLITSSNLVGCSTGRSAAFAPLKDAPARNGPPLNQLVRAQQQRLRDREAECLSCLAIDYQLELRRLQNRQIARFGAIENLAGVIAGLAIGFGKAWPVAHQAAGDDGLASFVARGNGVACGQCDELLTTTGEKGIGTDKERSWPELREGRESRVNLALGTRAKEVQLLPQRSGCLPHLPRLELGR